VRKPSLLIDVIVRIERDPGTRQWPSVDSPSTAVRRCHLAGVYCRNPLDHLPFLKKLPASAGRPVPVTSRLAGSRRVRFRDPHHDHSREHSIGQDRNHQPRPRFREVIVQQTSRNPARFAPHKHIDRQIGRLTQSPIATNGREATRSPSTAIIPPSSAIRFLALRAGSRTTNGDLAVKNSSSNKRSTLPNTQRESTNRSLLSRQRMA